MSILQNIQIQNIHDSDVVLNDLQITVPFEGVSNFTGKLPEDLSRSQDLIRALANDQVVLFDVIQSYELPQQAAIILVATGGGYTFVNWEGIPRVHASPRPLDHLTYYTSAGDDLDEPDPYKAKGGGERLLFNLTSSDRKKSVDLVFDETTQVKDGFMICTGAPFGASLDIEVVIPAGHPAGHPSVEIVVAKFGNKIPLLQNGWFPMDTDDGGRVYQGWILRVTVWNSMGNEYLSEGVLNPNYDKRQDTPASFKVAGRIEMFRLKTVYLPQ